MAKSSIVSVSSLDMSLSPFVEGLKPSKVDVDTMRSTGVLAPIVLAPASNVVLAGHYTVLVAREAGISEVPFAYAAKCDMTAERRAECVLAIDKIQSEPESGGKARLVWIAVHEEGSSVAGIVERTGISKPHVENLLRTWDKLSPKCRDAYLRGALKLKPAIKLAAMTHAEQEASDEYLATTAEHAARIKREREAERLRAKLAKHESVTTPTTPAPAKAPSTEEIRETLNAMLAALAMASGEDAVRLRGMCDGLAYVLGDSPIAREPGSTVNVKAA